MPQILAIALLLFALPASATAATLELDSGVERNTLIELYTSQGCSSCPPAERWLGSLQEDPRLWHDIIPLAFHVDYWDYLGWKDPLASPVHSARQRRYSRENGLSTVYTPGFVVNGREWRRWFGLGKIPVDGDKAGRLTLRLEGQHLEATFQPALPRDGKLLLHIALLGVGMSADIRGGENAGRQLPQDFVVLHYRTLTSTTGSWRTTLPAQSRPAVPRWAIAAWVSTAERQVPLQSVGGWLPPQGEVSQ